MIKYHILALLCLVAAAISAIEFLAVYYETHGDLHSGRFWIMILVFAGSITLYFRIRRLRKQAVSTRK